MTLLNLISFGLAMAIVAWEGTRGIVRPIFDAAGALIGVKVASYYAPLLTVGSPGSVQACVMAGIFLVITGMGILAGYYLDDILTWSAPPFNAVIGGAFGLMVGISAAHMLIRGLLLTYANTPIHDQIIGTLAARELYQFRTWHYFVEGLNP